jgi:uncharacterized membrane protein YGL010W
LEVAIANQCGRLLANAIIYYNSAILSRLLDKHLETGSPKMLRLFKKTSPVAWQHIHFLGHYTFYENRKPIDLDVLVDHVPMEALK